MVDYLENFRSMAKKAACIADNPAAEIVELLGGRLPSRWGRMPLLSRAMIVETGAVLKSHGLMKNGTRLCDNGMTVGLVGATRFGSMQTDLAFKKSMTLGPGLASPALFGYTLPNTPLAEAAVIFGLTGPVYAIYHDGDNLHERARLEAESLLDAFANLDWVLACVFDHYPGEDEPENIFVNLTVSSR
ncbi:hypothetical protein [Desulforhopalus singaporensis]|uniref:Beta-ketoacyl synthase, N-terminal domain n=1 Tax=Desulforhopalus singaporensis TaxID=91360 RepID=A0A1H0T458_9BACT|nr:hypothetical protein [Desulforhopalus singaporensis]SDP48847.1 hypothetical protein SAMN05660330_02921 [Desulforhopalus singaporensis]